MKRRISRRAFLRRTARGAAGGVAGFLILENSASARSTRANDRIHVALIGVGGRGRWFVGTIPRMENVVAICDVDDRKFGETFKKWAELASRFASSPHDWERNAAGRFQLLGPGSVKTFHDFRKMLDQMGKSIDAVIVATPDHTHAVASMAAMKAGKHVYCEKPLTRTVRESRALREAAKTNGVATQMGNQGTAAPPFREAFSIIRSGGIGEIRDVVVWNSGGGPDRKEPPGGSEPVPEGLEWDLWLGPRPARPFHREWYRWHTWRDFGTGQLGNWASHTANLAFMALQVSSLWYSDPGTRPRLRVEAEVSGINRLSFPRWEVIRWKIPARAGLKPITIEWLNGGNPTTKDRFKKLAGDYPAPGPKGMEKLSDFAGVIFSGTKGKLYATGHNATYLLFPADRFQEYRPPASLLPRSRGHEAEWFNACRGEAPALSNFDYSGPLNEFLQLGNVATQFEGTLEYDPLAGKIVNNEEADRALNCEYRKGWSL